MNRGKVGWFVAGIAVLVLLIGMVGPALASANEKVTKEPMIVMFDPALNEPAQQALVKKFGGEWVKPLGLINGAAIRLPEENEIPMGKAKGIVCLEIDAKLHAVEDTLPWGVDRIDAEIVWGGGEDVANVVTGNAGIGVDVAIIDTGIDYTHPDLNANYKGGYDYVNGDSDPKDDDGHGTHVAGIVAAEDNEVGVIGVAPKANLWALKVLDSTGSGSYSNLIAALDWCVEKGIKVASMSLGGTFRSRSLQKACDNAYKKGVLLVAAAGNNGESTGRIEYPAKYDSVIAVSALDKNADDPDSSNTTASFSSYGSQIELAGPGVKVYSTMPTYGVYLNTNYGYSQKYDYLSGTSMATPHVSGTAALVIASGIASGASAVRDQLDKTAEDLGTAGRDDYFGYGLVDAEAAVKEAAAPPPTAGTMHVKSIDMWYEAKGPNYFVYTKVTIVNADNNPVSGATVYLEMTLPDESKASGSGDTANDGTVTFKLRSRQTGTYTSTVTNVEKSGWKYNSSANVETSHSRTVP